MTESYQIMILGVSLEVFLLLASGIFYLMCAAYIWKPLREEKNELINALFAFLIYQAINMFFMGIELHTMNMVYGNIASFAVFIGSVYMLKFPLSSLSEKIRKIIFTTTLIAVVALFIWFIQTEEREMRLMQFTLWYDIIINGLIVGGFMIVQGLGIPNQWQKMKAIGSGSGVVSCCVVANGAMLSGAMLTGSFFGFLAPILITLTLIYTRKKQRQAPPVLNASV